MGTVFLSVCLLPGLHNNYRINFDEIKTENRTWFKDFNVIWITITTSSSFVHLITFAKLTACLKILQSQTALSLVCTYDRVATTYN